MTRPGDADDGSGLAHPGDENNDPEHPGKFADYIGNTNFDVDLQMHGGGFTATIAATSKLDS
jgi:hypothetical protein